MIISNIGTAVANSTITVKLFSYDSALIENAITSIKSALSLSSVRMKGPIPIPTRRKVFTVNRSPHIDKKSREHFEIITHIRAMVLLDCDSKVINCLLSANLPNGVEIKIRCSDSTKNF